ncbi:hypothetical protein [Novosphingobium sp. FSW06-99]|uniref:hypothetical protein n=1 Tax=Novosphingobium sp. FSW06-99 TaxID=1739113 RepID=UPI00076D72B2|nr:hypothetical protein [Novosphingobium sp. FSW06-99]KUR79065.1 hypothetical protein AQZ49_06535 [Novosphingobium sp. FSW06-99]
MTEPVEPIEPAFPRRVLKAIIDEAKITDPDRQAILAERLDYLAAYYRDVLSSMPNEFDRFAPFDATLTERVDWLDIEVLNPLKRLIDALSPENRAWFSLWPNDVIDELKPDYDAARAQLENLRQMAQNVVINLVVHRRTGLPFNEFLQFHIVTDIAKVLKEVVPELKPSRGTYLKEPKGFHGRYPAIVRMVFEAITGKADSLDRLIKELVDQNRRK